jgi:hypothetical protein
VLESRRWFAVNNWLFCYVEQLNKLFDTYRIKNRYVNGRPFWYVENLWETVKVRRAGWSQQEIFFPCRTPAPSR